MRVVSKKNVVLMWITIYQSIQPLGGWVYL